MNQYGATGLLLLCAAVGWAQPTPLGDDFQVNTLTLGFQDGADVGSTAGGDFVVVWQSEVSDGTDQDSFSIQARRFLANGTPVGAEFQVNTDTSGFQGWPSVAVSPTGDFAVVWYSEFLDVRGQLFDAIGAPVGGEFQVNTYTTYDQSWPNVAISPSGDFVVVWQSYRDTTGDDADLWSVQGQRFAADASPLGSQFQVNSFTTLAQVYPRVASDDSGNFVVVWHSFGSSGTDQHYMSVLGQRFDGEGVAQGGEFQVNTYTYDNQVNANVDFTADGGFVVVWDSFMRDGADYGISARRFTSTGSPMSGEFQVNTHTTGLQGYATVATNTSGGFVVAWHSDSRDSSDYGIAAQEFAGDGSPVGSEFLVNSHTEAKQYNPNIDFDPDGQFVVVWGSYSSTGSDDNATSTQMRRFSAGGIFSDGFESGDTSAWSSAVP